MVRQINKFMPVHILLLSVYLFGGFNSSDNYCAIHCNMFKYLALRVVGMQLCSSYLAARSRQLVMSSHNIEASPGSVPPGLNKVGEIITTQGLT
jgi:hypothetical protein